MKVTSLDLDQALQHGITIASRLPEHAWTTQFHPELSPVGWHIGHMVFIERYWLLEQVLGQPLQDLEKQLYFPWLSPKSLRGGQLPCRAQHLDRLLRLHEETVYVLNNLVADGHSHELLRDDYLLLFLVQHHHQHNETLMQVCQQYALQHSDPDFTPSSCPGGRDVISPSVLLESAMVTIGLLDDARAYDNEIPRHEVPVEEFSIASGPVSCAEYLGFVESAGYSRPEHWTPDGWRWLQQNNIALPGNWRRHDSGRYYIIDVATGSLGPREMSAAEPVTLLSHHEASAFASWAGLRLPTEFEWEYSRSYKSFSEDQSNQCWEWCSNTFQPYPGFRPFPYDGYSTPWFDNRHYVLRGASRFTSDWIKRLSFRNFYTADTRHIFSGLRLAD
ncbi:MAG: SUMF1/EgtB/PvdO family nonheme iron enzyme [Gammaproteobacteria bacterium]|nr:SUMF1/EgtB/PvdO family nonheme iron enzyme [Gammaproteobacteria bacterium]